MLRIALCLVVFATMAICHPLMADEDVVLVAKEDLPDGSLVRVRQELFSPHGIPNVGYNQEIGPKDLVFYKQKSNLPLIIRSKRQSGVGITGDHVPGVGGSATINGNWEAIKTPQDKLNIHGSHTQTFDHRLRPVGPGSNTAGFGYEHTSNNGRATWGVGSNTDFGRGRRPAHNVGANFKYRF